jgi:preprotein translocase subunit SecG
MFPKSYLHISKWILIIYIKERMNEMIAIISFIFSTSALVLSIAVTVQEHKLEIEEKKFNKHIHETYLKLMEKKG